MIAHTRIVDHITQRTRELGRTHALERVASAFDHAQAVVLAWQRYAGITRYLTIYAREPGQTLTFVHVELRLETQRSILTRCACALVDVNLAVDSFGTRQTLTLVFVVAIETYSSVSTRTRIALVYRILTT